MSLLRIRLAVLMLWVVSLFAVGAFVHAQMRLPAPLTDSTVYSGPDIGFRATKTDGRTVVGTLVIRVNGQWKDAEFAPYPRVQPIAAQ